jgi:hypothetical protein
MRCKTPRKGPRRTPPRLDPELENLASVIAEYELDNNAYGWFRMPWRDGWNAIGLAHAVDVEYRWLEDVLRDRSTEPSLYWQSEEQLADATHYPMRRAALRCLQVLLANSSGGGHVYNNILIPAFLHADPEVVSDDILEFRCRDSIGTTAVLKGDANDRQRAAFRTAWSRGLYMVAYSLPPATQSTGKLTVIK